MDTTQGPLFEGHNTYPLTDNEWHTLIHKKLNIITETPEQKEQIIAGLTQMKNNELNNLYLRQILNSDQPFNIICNTASDKILDKEKAVGMQSVVRTFSIRRLLTNNTNNDRILIHSGKLDDPEQCGQILIHEAIHQMQPLNMKVNPVLADMETQAFDELTELSSDSRWDIFLESGKKIYQKWSNVVAGTEPLPKWAFPFKPKEGLTDDERMQARIAYITQMTYQEMQANLMQDFLMSRQAVHQGKFSLKNQSYQILADSLSYNSRVIEKKCSDFTISDETVDYLKQQYPALDVEKVKERMSELSAEHEIAQKLADLPRQLKRNIEPVTTDWGIAFRTKKIDDEYFKKLADNLSTILNLSPQAREVLKNIPPQEIQKELARIIYTHPAFKNPDKATSGSTFFQANIFDNRSNMELIEKLCDIEIQAVENKGNALKEQTDFIINHPNLNENDKLFYFSSLIDRHKSKYPEKNSDEGKNRAEIIKNARQRFGINLPIVQNETNTLDTLHNCATPLREDEQPLNIPANERIV